MIANFNLLDNFFTYLISLDVASAYFWYEINIPIYNFVNIYSFFPEYKSFCLQFQVTWFRQDEAIREDDRTIIKSTETQVGTYMVVLELDDVVESDAGLYKIKAKNTYGEVSASINLNFSRKLQLVLIACF